MALGLALGFAPASAAQVRAWEGTLTLPTYAWADDVNPKFWALAGAAEGAAPPLTALVYPYTMQDDLSRTKADHTYKALFLENEYLKVACLPELGGRLHSVLDKTSGQEVFHLNHVIKPSMIGMRGAWISGGVEWNAGPQGHTVTCLAPVDALVGQNPDGSAYLEVSNLEKTHRTRWTVRLTLHPGRAYLDERIRLFNPTDALSPYYFWNCTAFPNRPGTRFIFPMTLGTDHTGGKFYSWPVHEGRDLTWLKNYETWASIFAVQCSFDFFGAYDVDADRGLVQVADHHKLGGKKAWTWGQWDFGLVSEKNLTDDDGPYIEVQSGPLPTQSDYGALWPRDEVSWQEWWYPVHGLGDGFELATKDVAVQTARRGNELQLRVNATGDFPAAVCTVAQVLGSTILEKTVDLAPGRPRSMSFALPSAAPVEIRISTQSGESLASFVSPLPISQVSRPTPPAWSAKPDEELTTDEAYVKGRKADLATDRRGARKYYELALAQDAAHVPALCALAVLELEAGHYERAVLHLEKALARDPSDGLSRYFLGVSCLKLGRLDAALRDAYLAARCFGTTSLGYDLAGRAHMRQRDYEKAAAAFADAVQANPRDIAAQDHLLAARYARGDGEVWAEARRRIAENPTDLIPWAVLALQDEEEMARFAREVRAFVGEVDFELLEVSLQFAELGLFKEASAVLYAACVGPVPEAQRTPLPLYHLAYWAARLGDERGSRDYLGQAAGINQDGVFESRPEAVEVLEFAVKSKPDDARARLHLGNLYAHLGRLDEAVANWKKAAELDPASSVAFRNLGLYSRFVEKDLPKAAGYYVKAVAARPQDQTLYRDLAEILTASGERQAAIELLESMPAEPRRRADTMILLAQAYLDEQRFSDAIELLELTPYFVAWEGQGTTWVIFNRAHLGRGQERFAAGDFAGALQDFEAALTYPENLGVGRSNHPEHAPAHYWRGKALQALGRLAEARLAWTEGAAGAEGSAEQNQYRQLCSVALWTTR